MLAFVGLHRRRSFLLRASGVMVRVRWLRKAGHLDGLPRQRHGYLGAVTSPEEPTLDDVMDTHESAVPDHRAHAKEGKHVDDDDLEARTEEERREVDAD
ncbi:hypothetical protein [uncultured Jatrophihabitans sp.]|uniref:hypothetical protein n=1 Tax=uncultured Jatrophihabitans sp. TaxID=1610747 RepID=UPI0035CAEBCB